jgi:hypothetical protein
MFQSPNDSAPLSLTSSRISRLYRTLCSVTLELNPISTHWPSAPRAHNLPLHSLFLSARPCRHPSLPSLSSSASPPSLPPSVSRRSPPSPPSHLAHRASPPRQSVTSQAGAGRRRLPCLRESRLVSSASLSLLHLPDPSPPAALVVSSVMHKLTTFAGGVRHGWDSMPFGVNRSQQHHDLARSNAAAYQRPSPVHQQLPHTAPISWCFKVPFNNTLAGPEPSHIVYASKGARERWTHPAGQSDIPTHRLPVHLEHIEALRSICSRIKTDLGVEATVAVGRATSLALVPGIQPTPTNNVVANVCLHGRDYDTVRRAREVVLNQSPITMVLLTSTHVDTRLI